jgi:hypothetical protein
MASKKPCYARLNCGTISYKEVTSVPAPGTPPLANSAPGSEHRPGKGPKATVQVRIPLAAGPTPSRTVWRSRTRTAGDDRTVYLDGQRCNGKIKAASKADFIFSLNAVLREHCKRGYLKSNVVANPTQIRLLDERSVKMQLSSLKRKAAFYSSAVSFVLHLQRKPLDMLVFACRIDHGT